MENTTLCYLERGEEYLFLHRTKKEHDINHDKWMGVGGHFEEGESPEECMKREVWEETGLTVTSYRYRGIVTFIADGNYTEYMHLFTADAWTGEQKICNEGDLEWVSKKASVALPMWEGDRIFLDLLEREVPFFSLKLTYQSDRLTQAVRFSFLFDVFKLVIVNINGIAVLASFGFQRLKHAAALQNALEKVHGFVVVRVDLPHQV